MGFNEERVKIPGFTIACKSWHSNATQPTLCLHGKMDNAASFDLLAPLLPDFTLTAVDYPGTGFSSSYPEGVLPHWKNDAFLMVRLIQTLQWKNFNIIAHSLGSLLATVIAIALPNHVKKIVFLDILGPTVNFIENGTTYLNGDIATYLSASQLNRTQFPTEEAAILNRMQTGNISYQAAQALVRRGVQMCAGGWQWTFDNRLRCVSSTVPYEDELRALFQAVQPPICLVRAKQGVPYPEKIFSGRAESIKNLMIHEVEGGHHVHMDDPEPLAKIISDFLNC